MTTGNGERISDRVGQAFRDYDAACDDRARTAALKDCVYALTQSVQSIYRRLPKRPWIWQAVQSVGVLAVLGGAVWFGSFQSSVKAETARAVEVAAEAKTFCVTLDTRARALEVALVELLARQSERDRRAGVDPPSPAERRAIAQQFGLTPPDTGDVKTP